jgi:hypothetical protein
MKASLVPGQNPFGEKRHTRMVPSIRTAPPSSSLPSRAIVRSGNGDAVGQSPKVPWNPSTGAHVVGGS